MSGDVGAVRDEIAIAEMALRIAEKKLEQHVDDSYLGEAYLQIGQVLTLLSDTDDLLSLKEQS